MQSLAKTKGSTSYSTLFYETVITQEFVHMSVPSQFSVPNNGESFSEFVFDRCEQLIDAKIWKSISIKDYSLWKNNFSGETERYFAALVLDALVYRSREQTIASIQQAFQRTIYELGLDKEVDWIQRLAFGKDAGIRLVPVIIGLAVKSCRQRASFA